MKIIQFIHQAVFFVLEPMRWDSVTLHLTLHYPNKWSVSCEQLNLHNFAAALLMPSWVFYFSFSRKSFHSVVVFPALFFLTSDFMGAPLCALAVTAALQLAASQFLSFPWRASGRVVKCCRSVTSYYKNSECQTFLQRINRSWSLVLQES